MVARPKAIETKPLSEGDTVDESAGVQAIETGIRVLAAMIDLGAAPMLKTIAERAGMPPPKAHRYLASFCRSGLVDRDSSNGYRLGPLAVRLGLAALRHLDVVSVATPLMAQLRDEIGFSVGLAVWGTSGPTLVRFEETNDVLIISGRPGSVMPLLTSATGRVFGAYLPRAVTEPFIVAELKTQTRVKPAPTPDAKHRRMSRFDVDAMFESIRSVGLATVEGDLNRGIHAIAAPVFDHTQALVGVIAALGGAGLFDSSLQGANAHAVKAKAAAVSYRLGAS